LPPTARHGRSRTCPLGAPVEKTLIAFEDLAEAIPQLSELLLPEREFNDDCLVHSKDRNCLILEFYDRVVRKEFEALDPPVAGLALLIQLDVIAIETEGNVLSLRRLVALQDQVARGVELGIREADGPKVRVFLDRYASGIEVAAHGGVIDQAPVGR
jgi:hypothetical protein